MAFYRPNGEKIVDQERIAWLNRQSRVPIAVGQPFRLPAALPLVALPPCIYLGEPTGEMRDCLTCAGSVRVKLMQCKVHGVCTPGKAAEGVAFCGNCRERRTFAGNSILITGGIGDMMAVESLMRPEERERLETIYYACPNASWIIELIKLLPNYPRLRNHIRLPTRSMVYYERRSVERAIGPLPPGPVEDWSIIKIFPQNRPYVGSSFLSCRLAEKVQAIGQPYAVIVPRSRGFGMWADRDFNPTDWAVCLDALKRGELIGVVLTASVESIPNSPLLLDLQGKTTLPEAVEILKAARGFMGIDSCLSVLAAKLFPASRLCIKAVNDHAYNWGAVYYAPWKTFPFLKRRLEAPTWD